MVNTNLQVRNRFFQISRYKVGRQFVHNDDTKPTVKVSSLAAKETKPQTKSSYQSMCSSVMKSILLIRCVLLWSAVHIATPFSPISGQILVSTPSSSRSTITLSAYQHTLAILTLPKTSTDKIANESILTTSMSETTNTGKLSIVLRCPDGYSPSISDLRGYVGEIYSLAWDIVLNLKKMDNGDLLDVIVYPHNLPNTAPETWITHRPDLDCICSHDSVIGWSSLGMGSGHNFDHVKGQGIGGVKDYVNAVNSDREVRGLKKITAIQPNDWPGEIWTDDSIVFLEDYDGDINIENDSNKGENDEGFLTGGYHVPSSSLYNHVAVGGTFDGMHYGHRKLLTLAVSSVVPNTGLLTIGITKDEMLQQKEFATLIPNLKTRIKGVKDFVGSLAPGMKNRIKIVPIEDKYGPPGAPSNSDVYKEKNDYDALVLSHETLETGRMLNKHRVDVLGMPPLTLLCTRRTEAYGMSSTTLRRMKNTTNVVNECEIS